MQYFTSIHRFLIVLCLLAFQLSLMAAVPAELKGSWEGEVDYETHTFTFLSDSQMELDGETFNYTVKEGVVVVDYEEYPYRFAGGDLWVTIEGRECRFKRVDRAAPGTPQVDLKPFIGFWKSKTEWGTQYLQVISANELEFEGQRVSYALTPGKVRVHGEEFPYTLKDDKLTVTVPDEGRQVVFTRDPSVFLGTWKARRDGWTIPLVFHSDKELEYDYERTSYQLVPGAIRVEGVDYPYRFEGKFMVTEVDGASLKFQRDAEPLVGTWQAQTPQETVTVQFLSTTQLKYDGEVHTYTLTPGSIHVDDLYLSYRLTKDTLLIAVPKEGEFLFKRVKQTETGAKPTFMGTWEGETAWETVTLKILSDTELEYQGETFEYRLVDGAVRVDYEDHPYHFDGETLVVTIDGESIRFKKIQ